MVSLNCWSGSGTAVGEKPRERASAFYPDVIHRRRLRLDATHSSTGSIESVGWDLQPFRINDLELVTLRPASLLAGRRHVVAPRIDGPKVTHASASSFYRRERSRWIPQPSIAAPIVVANNAS